MNHTFIPILIFLKYKENVHHFQLHVITLNFNIYFMQITSNNIFYSCDTNFYQIHSNSNFNIWLFHLFDK